MSREAEYRRFPLGGFFIQDFGRRDSRSQFALADLLRVCIAASASPSCRISLAYWKGHVSSSTSGSRGGYGSGDSFDVEENDTPAVTLSTVSLVIADGETDTYTVALDTQPSGDVTVVINDPTDNTDVTASPRLPDLHAHRLEERQDRDRNDRFGPRHRHGNTTPSR